MKPRTVAALLALAVGGSACAPRSSGAGRRAPLPRDSAAALERAVRMARPGFETQDEALRAGAYRGTADSAAPVPAAPPAALETPGGGFVIQIAAYRDRASAEVAARDAQRSFPALEVVVEEGGGYFRVALAGWRTAAEAAAPLSRVKASYPGAWVRARSVP